MDSVSKAKSSMQFKKSVVVGVLITLYLSTDSWCHYIPEKKNSSPGKKNGGSSSHKDRIQICGDALTTMIIEACDGIVGSPSQGNLTRESLQTKVTEDCCDHECPLDYLQNYCGQTPSFAFKKTVRGNLLNRLGRSRTNAANKNDSDNSKDKKKTEVRIKEKADRRKRGKRGRKKRKRSFKRKCTFKSFGHYLLKLDRDDRVRSNISKRHNTMNVTWPSIQIGTIPPDMEELGGQPIVVVKKNNPTSS